MSEGAVTEITKDKLRLCWVKLKALLIFDLTLPGDASRIVFLICSASILSADLGFNSVAPRIHFITEGGSSSYRQRRGWQNYDLLLYVIFTILFAG